MMLVQWYLVHGLLLLPDLFTLGQAVSCSSNQYGWPTINPSRCCNKCEAGSYMVKRCDTNSNTKCKQCERNYYMDRINNELDCKRCTACTKDHMTYERNCTKNEDSKCGCKSQYRCNNDRCEYCLEIPPTQPPPTMTTKITTTTVTSPTSTKTAMTISTKTNKPTPPNPESVWITLSLCCACVCILLTCFILISRHASACGRLMLASTECFWTSKKGSTRSSQCTEDEEVPMPVQEVCEEKV